MTKHTEIQKELIDLGIALGYKIWIPESDKNMKYEGERIGENTMKELKLPFPLPTLKIIKNIDVVWTKKNVIEAAFEVEATSTIYSGLLRLSDLMSSQPNINVKLFILVPKKREKSYVREISRPTFNNLDMHTNTRLITFEDLFKNVSDMKRFGESSNVLDQVSKEIGTDQDIEDQEKKDIGITKKRRTWKEQLDWANPNLRREVLPEIRKRIKDLAGDDYKEKEIGRWLEFKQQKRFLIIWTTKRNFGLNICIDPKTFADPKEKTRFVKGFFYKGQGGQERRFRVSDVSELDYAFNLVEQSLRWTNP